MNKKLTSYTLIAVLLLMGGLSSFAQGDVTTLVAVVRHPSGGGSVPDTTAANYYLASLETYSLYPTTKSKKDDKIKKAVTFYKIKCKSCCLYNWSSFPKGKATPGALVKVTDPKLLGELQKSFRNQLKTMSNAFD